ncbi:MAG: putative HD superfamily hydrolase [Candidatus Nanosalina sp. J07AB43]|nr:MAG: putative HD superfamily hydrolase [Candidatus Nanosalina sp. J07AB43]
MIDVLLDIYDLKDEKRTGWELRRVDDPESVAGHSWGVSFLALNFMPENLDSEKVLKLCIVHDMAEAEVGDIAHRAVDANEEISSDEKQELEKRAIERYSGSLESDPDKLWKEYDSKRSEEAIFVKDMDLIDMCLQALKYENKHRYDPDEVNENFQEYEHMDEFFATTEPRLKTEKANEIFQSIKSRYESVKESGSS